VIDHGENERSSISALFQHLNWPSLEIDRQCAQRRAHRSLPEKIPPVLIDHTSNSLRSPRAFLRASYSCSILGPDQSTVPLSSHGERHEKIHCFPQSKDVAQTLSLSGLWLASKDQIATGEKIHLRYWTIGKSSVTLAQTPVAASEVATILAGKLDRTRRRPDFAFPV
jgi:hypothetical protein